MSDLVILLIYEHANITEVYSVIRKYCRVSFLWHLQYRSRGVGRIFEMRGQIYNYQRGGGGMLCALINWPTQTTDYMCGFHTDDSTRFGNT